MKNQTNHQPVHLFFELIQPESDLYIYQLDQSSGEYEEETIQSYTFEQLLEISLETLTEPERVAARARIAGSVRKFLELLEPAEKS